MGLDRYINKNFRMGVGYNLTEFSDKVIDSDYDDKYRSSISRGYIEVSIDGARGGAATGGTAVNHAQG